MPTGLVLEDEAHERPRVVRGGQDHGTRRPPPESPECIPDAAGAPDEAPAESRWRRRRGSASGPRRAARRGQKGPTAGLARLMRGDGHLAEKERRTSRSLEGRAPASELAPASSIRARTRPWILRTSARSTRSPPMGGKIALSSQSAERSSWLGTESRASTSAREGATDSGGPGRGSPERLPVKGYRGLEVRGGRRVCCPQGPRARRGRRSGTGRRDTAAGRSPRPTRAESPGSPGSPVRPTRRSPAREPGRNRASAGSIECRVGPSARDARRSGWASLR